MQQTNDMTQTKELVAWVALMTGAVAKAAEDKKFNGDDLGLLLTPVIRALPAFQGSKEIDDELIASTLEQYKAVRGVVTPELSSLQDERLSTNLENVIIGVLAFADIFIQRGYNNGVEAGRAQIMQEMGGAKALKKE